MDVPLGRFVELPVASVCVDNARGVLLSRFTERPDPPLRDLLYGVRSGNIHESRHGLQDLHSRKYVGQIVHQWQTWDDGDPVDVYLGIGLQSGRAFEAVGFRCEPNTLNLFDSGTSLGRLVEKQLPPDKRWWRRMLGGERLWHVFLHEEFIGVLQLVYPVGNSTVLQVKLHNGVAWPICLGRVWFRVETRFVIPPDAPPVPTDDLLALYVTLSALMRIHVGHVY